MNKDPLSKRHVVSAHFNLQPYHAARYAGFVDKHGSDYRLTSLLLRTTAEYALLDQQHSPQRGFEVERLPNCAGKEALDCQICERLFALNPDVILLLGGYSEHAMLTVIRWAIRHRVPMIICSETKADDHARGRIQEHIKSRIWKLFSAALVGGKPHASYARQLGFPEDRVFMGYDAVDNDYFSRQSQEIRRSPEEWRVKFDLPKQYIFASARFIEKKNFARLLGAYSRYRQLMKPTGLPPWELVLLGGGPCEEELRQICRDDGLSDFVHMPGFKQYPDLPAYYALARCFVHPSTREEWGLVVNEAMASGLPVLISDRCGCASSLVKDGTNGFTFDPYDVESLANHFLKLTEMSGEERLAMAESGREIINNWGPGRFGDGLKSACETALQMETKRPGRGVKILLKALSLR